ncbi:uncharacterized protein BT62DRAFT_1029978 [Guyanagaster necrorhizus]|uniref:Uncharacterized protein n=1 Tax=Guyanagaster necrorhizus TaxID=856835 RepID=A0A9P7VMQ6_9AGAR|nr:uncharacterized protein BT62DRAFT_1029978 [Guyanagaster necrorhizus MCA 3950]KAG7444046.1 hypothetical protein BT62DRAFT_1029978 [Guyanagaster necrorhizus MCA 3950]
MLPTELCNLVIDHFHDTKPSLLTCSLVRRVWDSESHFHLFHKVQLCRDTADSFFQLFESPHATLASAHIRELDVAQNSVTKGGSVAGDLLDGRAFQGVLTRCPADVFEHVQKLSVTCVGRWTLTDAEKLSIGHRFKSAEVLSLRAIWFRAKDSEEDHSDAKHTLSANLHTISLNDVTNPRIIRFLIPCLSLRVFKCHCVNFGNFGPKVAKEFGRLLLSSGERLEEFGFTIQAAASLNDGVDLDIDLSRLSNLRQIALWIEDNQYLIPFLKRLTESDWSIATLETLGISYLSEHDLDSEKLDEIVQYSYFCELKEIEISVKVYYGLEYIAKKRVRYERPNDGSKSHIEMVHSITRFMEKLSSCQARGILRPADDYWIFDNSTLYGQVDRQTRRGRFLRRISVVDFLAVVSFLFSELAILVLLLAVKHFDVLVKSLFLIVV